MASRAKLLSTNTALTPKQFTFTLYNAVSGTLNLRFAPSGWDEDEYTLTRDLFYFGVFRKFSVGDLKFVKDSRDYLSEIYEREGVNGACTFIVTEYIPTGTTRNRFTGTIDFSTYKITELSVDVQIKDGSFTDLVLTRAKTEVDIMKSTAVNGEAVTIPSLQYIYSDEVNIFNFGAFTLAVPTLSGNHIIPIVLGYTTFDELITPANNYNLETGAFLVHANGNYTASQFAYVLNIYPDNAEHFAFNIQLMRFIGGTFDSIIDEEYNTSSGNAVIPCSKIIDFDINTGDHLVFQLTNVLPGSPTFRYENSSAILRHNISTMPQRIIWGIGYFDALKALVQQYTGLENRVKSDFLTKYVYLSPDGLQQGVITQYKWLLETNTPEQHLTTSLEKFFNSIGTVYNLGIGIETIGGVEKIVIEQMGHFFDDTVILDISDRIAPETIEKMVFPELIYNRINGGFSSYDSEVEGGIFEPNTNTKWSTPIKSIDKELKLISDYRGDTTGIFKIFGEEAQSITDDASQGDLFMIDTVIESDLIHARVDQGFDFVSGLANTINFFNLDMTPARILYRWGAYLRGFLEKNLTGLIKWQKTEKNSTLVTHKEDEDPTFLVGESWDVDPNNLAEPLWHAEIFTVEVPALVGDIEAIKENPYGLVKLTATEYGWLLSYKSKNENKKSEFKLLRCNTTYVTPHLRVS